jgi:predicted pyridoxine 5'-phosphate oxidase superfamily flavin-nucleotide-binding protein
VSGSHAKAAGWAASESPFHAGEQAVQERFGLRERLQQTGRRVVRDFMPDEHRELFEDLPFVVAGSADVAGQVWASLLIGEPGFVRSPHARSLVMNAQPLAEDPLRQSLRQGAPLGLLGIELPTRRRNRANGHVVRAAGDSFELAVEQSFGNCNKYIQARAGLFAAPPAGLQPTREAALLSVEALRVLAHSDTSFLATSSREPERGGSRGLDVSHRGGRPGFIRADAVDDATLLTMPDFSGNFLFNSFGNLEENPRAGLLVLDFDSGDLLSVTGQARVIWDGPEVDAFEGAERLLQFRVGRGLLWAEVARGWSHPEFSPHLRRTGSWSAR